MIKNSETFKLIASGEREIVITRAFDAPPELVFDAYTRPELLKRWLLGPSGWAMPVCEVDLREGGAYRFVWRSEEGSEIAMGGIYREIKRPEKLVNTEKFYESWYPGESLLTMTLTKKNGGTMFKCTILYETHQAREIVLNSKMESGVIASYDRLEEVLMSIFKVGEPYESSERNNEC